MAFTKGTAVIRTILFAICLASPAYSNGYDVGDVVGDPMVIVRAAVNAFTPMGEGRPALAVQISREEARRIVAVTEITGFTDDSVDGEQHRYVLERGDTQSWTIVEAQRLFRCYRGNNTNWQTGLCP